jgi:hypothetical protein
MFIMSKLRFVVLAMITAVSPIAVVAGGGIAHAQAPSTVESCTVMHATAQDTNGRTMWCNPTMTGDHRLVWQYGGPH